MKSFDGYLKRKFGDSYVLLAGGGTKALSDFLMTTDKGYSIPKFTFMLRPGYWYIPAVNSKISNEDTGDWWGLHGKVEVKSGDTFYIKGHGGSDPDLWAWADTSDIIRQVSGDQVYYTDYLSITAPLDGYLYFSFNKDYSHNIIFDSWLPGYIHEANYKNYTVTKTGVGASGTWGINISGKASTAGSADNAYTLSSWAQASNESTARYIWMSHNDNSGRAAYCTNFYYVTSTGTCYSTNFSGHLIGSAERLSQSSITSLDTFTHSSDLIYSAAGGSNSVSGKPTGVDAFGVLSYKTADGWYGLLLTSSNLATGLYWRTASNTLSGGWKKVLDSTNYTDYTVTKSGSGASGTWGINITGNSDTVDGYHSRYFVPKFSEYFQTGYWYVAAVNGTITSYLPSDAWRRGKILVKAGDSFYIKGRGGSDPDLYAFTDNNSKVLSVSGDLVAWEGSYHEITASYDGYLYFNFNTGYAYGLIPKSWLPYYLNEANYTNYTVTKTGTGASGTWPINISGTANMIKNDITVAGSTSENNGIWFSNGTRTVLFGNGSSGNTGMYINGIGWIVGMDPSGNVYLNGNATSANNSDTVDGYHGYEFIRKNTNTSITFTDGYYLGTNSTNIASSTTNLANWKYVKLSVKRGDKFLIKGDGGSTPRLWAFADTSNKIITRANDEANYANYTEITAGQDGYLVVNFDKNHAPTGDLIPISWVSGFLNRANISPSLGKSGNNITITVGGITSSAFTVPYATSSGSADEAYTVSSWARVSGTPARYIWMSHSDNLGHAGYSPYLTFDPTTLTLSTYSLNATNSIYSGGAVQAATNIIAGDDGGLLWNSGSWWQRLVVYDTGDTSKWTFKFQQSEGTSGSSWVDYFTIYKNAAYIGSNIVYHAGNLPAYPTKSSWNYDDRYLKIFSLDSYNIDTIYNSGLYELYGASNTPAATYGVLLCMGYRKHTGNNNPDYCTQIYMPAGNSGTSPDGLFYRTSQDSSWRSWLEVLTVLNWDKYISLLEYYPKSSWTKRVGYWYTPAVGGKHSSYNSSTTSWVSYKYRVKAGDSFLIKGRGGYDPDLYAFTDTNEIVKSISGDGIAWEGGYHTITASYDGYLYVNFNTGYAYGLIPTSWTPWYLTEGNYTDYTVTKTGGGASGTWGIDVTGSASSAYTVSSWALSGGSEDRYIWHSHSDNSGRAAYNNKIMFNPNAGTLKVTNVSSTGTWYIGNSSGDYVNIGPGYINIRKYSPVNPTTNLGTISFDYYGGQTVYIAYTPNDGYRTSKGIKIFGDSSDNSNCWLEVLNNVYALNYYTTSDITKKTNFIQISQDKELNFIQFTWKESGLKSYGLIALQVKDLYPELVDGEEGNMTVNYSAALCLTVGQLQRKIKELEQRLRQLENINK